MNQYMLKKEIRKKYLEIRDNENSEQVVFIQANLFGLPEFNEAENIFIYASTGSEPDTYEIIDKALELDKKIFLPKCIKGTKTMKAYRINSRDELKNGSYGIPEPEVTNEEFSDDGKSLIICPGLCFTENGDRLGYGGGYYDRFLERFKGKIPILALCYENMIAASVPTEETDIGMDIIITQERIIRT